MDSSREIGSPSHLLGKRKTSALTAYLIAVLRSVHPVISIFSLVSWSRSSPSPIQTNFTSGSDSAILLNSVGFF
jgi:hypothetical protein